MKLVEESTNKARVRYDSKKDILYIVIKEGVEEEFVEIASGINIELDDEKKILGIEIFDASRFLKPLLKKNLSR